MRFMHGAVLILAMLGAFQVRAVEPTGSRPTGGLPVSRVTLFSSGVAYYERSATVDGDASIRLTFKVEQINDILKSLVVLDLDGGRVKFVTYAPREPITQSLKSFGIDLTDNPSLHELLGQLRGVGVRVTLAGRADPVEGTIIGLETIRRTTDKPPAIIEEPILNLLCSDGIRAVNLRNASRVQLMSDRLNAELQGALKVLAAGTDAGKKPVTIALTGKGRRRILAAYILEAPVWKTSYRLVLSEDDEPLLQGWAMVDNTTDEDWDKVSLSLVSGRPISFIQDLYTPLYVPRPVVRPEIYAFLRPKLHEEAVFSGGKKARKKSRARKRALAPMEARAEADRDGMDDLVLHLDSYSGGIGGAVAGSVVSAASGREVGELFSYDIATPVTLARQKSAMLPIVNESVKARKLSIFNVATHAKYPLNAVRLSNSTGLNLMQGPVTIFDGGTYAGDGRLPDMTDSESRIVSYALDLVRTVTVERESDPEVLVAVKAVRGTIVAERRHQKKTVYTVKNKEDAPRAVLIEHAYQPDWKLLEPDEPEDRTDHVYRFSVTVPANGSRQLTVRQQRTFERRIVLRSANDGTIALYLNARATSPKLKAALKSIIDLRAELHRKETKRKQFEKGVQTIQQEQKRLRNNMAAVPKTSDLFARYLNKLDKQETQVEQAREKIAHLRFEENHVRERLEALIASIDLD